MVDRERAKEGEKEIRARTRRESAEMWMSPMHLAVGQEDRTED